MRLLYLYLDFTKDGSRPEGDRGCRQCELNFGTRDVYTLERISAENPRFCLKQTKRTQRDRIESGFWGDERIYNISAVVGENGMGKSTLMNAITRVLKALYADFPEKLGPYFVCLMQDTEGTLHLIYFWQGAEIETANFSCQKTAYSLGNVPVKAMQKTKLVYFSNTVSISDMEQYDSLRSWGQEIYADPMYNCSLLASMMRAQNSSGTNAKRQPLDKRALEQQLYTYFMLESYQETRYLFDRNQRNILRDMREKGYPVPFPRELKLRIRLAVEHLETVLKDCHDPAFRDRFEQWKDRYNQFRRQSNNQYRIIVELILNCVANFLETAGSYVSREDIQKLKFPENFDSMPDYLQMMRSVFSPRQHPELENTYETCKRYLEFLWNNNEHIRNYWRPQKNRVYTIALGDYPDPILQELMTRFLNFNRSVSNADYFVTYHWGLSSGESVLLRIFTKLWYLLSGNPYDEESTGNITPRAAKKAALARREEIIENRTGDCDSVILFLDEADLSLHPEWQRLFVAVLAEYLPRLYRNPYYEGADSGCRDIQIILTTHSPLMLGDFPSSAVLYLKKDKGGCVAVECSALQPFGQNLYTLLKDGFYLKNGTIGGLAQKKIKQVLADINRIREMQEEKRAKGLCMDDSQIAEWKALLEGHQEKTVKYISEGILRSKLEEEISVALAAMMEGRDRENKERKKQALKEDIARLQRQLEELERGEEEPS